MQIMEDWEVNIRDLSVQEGNIMDLKCVMYVSDSEENVDVGSVSPRSKLSRVV